MLRSFLAASVAAACFAGALSAQEPAKKPFKTPRSSPAAFVRQDVGLATASVEFARPKFGGRDFAAETATLKGPWRFGANAATKLVVSHPAKVGGKELAAGSYALFASPGKNSWTVIVNSAAEQWGAYFHDPKRDVLRFETAPVEAPHEEHLSFAFDVKSESEVLVVFRWGTVKVAFPLSFDVVAIEDAAIADALKSLAPDDWGTRLQIAQIRVGRKTHLDEAFRLLEEAAAVSKSFWLAEWRGRTLHAMGRTAEALPHLERAVEASSKGGAPEEYRTNLTKEIAAIRESIKRSGD